MLVVLSTSLVISVNITQLGANRLLVLLTKQNARAFPIRSVIYEVSVEYVNVSAIALSAMLVSRTLIVKNALVSGVPQIFVRLVVVATVISTCALPVLRCI